jgi:hypothetical protein
LKKEEDMGYPNRGYDENRRYALLGKDHNFRPKEYCKEIMEESNSIRNISSGFQNTKLLYLLEGLGFMKSDQKRESSS